MEWQAMVFALQILILATGWALFQKARAELSARAAEMPVLSEVRALQRNVKQLLAEIETASERASVQVESRCNEARELLASLERKLEAVNAPLAVVAAPAEAPAPKRTRKPKTAPPAPTQWTPEPPALPSSRAAKRQVVYTLADGGQAPAAIARETDLSEGEVETLLSLRGQRMVTR